MDNTVRLVILVCLLFPTGCKKDDVNPSSPPEIINLLPLEVGNQWTTQNFYFDSLGSVIHTDPPENITILGDTTINGQVWHYRLYFGYRLAYKNSASGTMTRLVSPNTDGIAKLLFKAPANIGDVYSFPMVYFAGPNAWLVDSLYRCTIITRDTSITVPAGTFRCYQFRVFPVSTNETWVDYFISAGHGWIKQNGYSRFVPGGSIFLTRSTYTISLMVRT